MERSDRRFERRRCNATGRLVLALAVALAACNVERQLYLSGLPDVGTELRVAAATERHGYLDVTLDGPDTRLRAFVPADETCAGLLRPSQEVRFAARARPLR